MGAESKMAIRAVDVAGPEGTWQIKGQMHLQGAAGEPGADALEGWPLNDPEAEKVLIEGRATPGRSVTMRLTWWSAS